MGGPHRPVPRPGQRRAGEVLHPLRRGGPADRRIPDLPYTHAFTDDAARDPRYVAARERVTANVIEGGSNVRGFADQTVVATLTDGRVITKVVPTLEAASYPVEQRIAIFRNTVEFLGGQGRPAHRRDHELREAHG